MRRRDFITVIAGSATTWPLAARAQQPQMPVLGFLSPRSQKDSANLIPAFHAGLGENGYVEERNLRIEFRWAESHYDRFPAFARELVAHRVAAIVTTSLAGALAAKAATSAIPIVFLTGEDPVEFGLVSSLNRPTGNVTGVTVLTNTLAPKQLQLLREVVPTATLISFLANPTNPIARVLPRLRDTYTRLKLYLVEDLTERLIASLHRGELDDEPSTEVVREMAGRHWSAD
jgi:putative ABC transport system substrate-binding protein